MENRYYPFANQPLPYDYGALEPYIDETTMMLHHDRHLQTYINNLNKALDGRPGLQKLSLEELLRNASRLPRELEKSIRNNAGGVYNHRFFFDGLSDKSGKIPPRLLSGLSDDFGSIDSFMSQFKESAMSVFGSGYAWLISDRSGMRIITTKNQDSPIEQGLCPILAIDVWEHAYYLKHYNLRADYIDDWFCVVNWEHADELYGYCSCEKRRRKTI